MPVTKVYRNDSKETLNVLGIGEIPAGEQVSVTGEHLLPVILVNYPGLVDVIAEEAAAAAEAPAPKKVKVEEAPSE